MSVMGLLGFWRYTSLKRSNALKLTPHLKDWNWLWCACKFKFRAFITKIYMCDTFFSAIEIHLPIYADYITLNASSNYQFFVFSLISYLAAPQPTLGPCPWVNLTKTMVITAFLFILTGRSPVASQRVCVLTPGPALSGVCSRNLPILNVTT